MPAFFLLFSNIFVCVPDGWLAAISRGMRPQWEAGAELSDDPIKRHSCCTKSYPMTCDPGSRLPAPVSRAAAAAPFAVKNVMFLT